VTWADLHPYELPERIDLTRLVEVNTRLHVNHEHLA